MSQSESPQDPQKRLREVHYRFTTPRAIMALILREMSTTYGRSPGGYIWAVLEPVAGIVLLTIIFSVGFRSPPLGTSFAVFYATGVLPFIMYSDLSGKMGQTLNFSRSLLEYPRATFIDALLARFLLNTITLFMVHFLIVVGLFIFITPDITLDFREITLSYSMVLALAIGIGTFNAFLFLAYPVWQNVWAVLNRPLFIISCILFLFESVPQPYNDILWFNPLVHIIGEMRAGFYPYYKPTYISPAFVFGVASTLTLVGLFLLNRYHRDILDK